jgi:hypothetical protein
MRQWGSSVHHNGLSFYLATAPEGSIFYHGGLSPDRPVGFDWLAFEVEHAAHFATSREFTRESVASLRAAAPGATRHGDNETLAGLEPLLRHRASHARPSSDAPYGPAMYDPFPSQRPITMRDYDKEDLQPNLPPTFDQLLRGYFHIYRANRPLNLLYIDGQGAAKGPLGTLDSQDLILLGREHVSPGPPDLGEDWLRAGQLCALASEWGGGQRQIDGFVRMEAGFEIVYCDFSAGHGGGLDLVSVQPSPFGNETGLEPHQPAAVFEWLRAAVARFHGHPAGRLDVDWSSMVSAYSYPFNISNPDRHRRDLPRAVSATPESRLAVRDRLRDVLAARGGSPQQVPGRRSRENMAVINWQGVVDSIVTRFSERLGYIVANDGWSRDGLLRALGTMVDPFINYTDRSALSERRAVDRCARHYLLDPSSLLLTMRSETWTPEDQAVAVALRRVSSSICDALFLARGILRADSHTLSPVPDVVKQARQVIVDLTGQLRWSTWRECKGGCQSPDEICSIPMFPVGGSEEDYFHPSCKNITALLHSFGYWHTDGGRKASAETTRSTELL